MARRARQERRGIFFYSDLCTRTILRGALVPIRDAPYLRCLLRSSSIERRTPSLQHSFSSQPSFVSTFAYHPFDDAWMRFQRLASTVLSLRSPSACFVTSRLHSSSSPPPNSSVRASVVMSSSSKIEAPAAERNKEPIWQVLQAKVLPLVRQASVVPKDDSQDTLRILEIAAGTGVHTLYFSQQLLEQSIPYLWYPTDPEVSSLASIQAYLQDDKRVQDYVKTPSFLTLTPDGILETNSVLAELMRDKANIILTINMIHVAPWSITTGLIKAANSLLKPGGILFLYGPFRVQGTYVESNR